MVKVSKILICLALIFHVQLTTSLSTDVLQEHNLTTLLANITGELKIRNSHHKRFDPLKLKGTVIKRPINLPGRLALLILHVGCENLKTFVAFCVCCALNNRNTVIDELRTHRLSAWERFTRWVGDAFGTRRPYERTGVEDNTIITDTRIQGPYLSDMFREYRESEYYNYEFGNQPTYREFTVPSCPDTNAISNYDPIIPCIPQQVEDIVRPYDPSTSNPPSHHPSTSSPTAVSATHNEVALINAPGFGGTAELLTHVAIVNSRTRNRLHDIYNQMQNIVRPRGREMDRDRFLQTILDFALSNGISVHNVRARVYARDYALYLFCADINDEDYLHNEELR